MGDRANVFLPEPDYNQADRKASIGVYLYTHWGGERLPFDVQKALSSKAGRNRWSDNAYLARIIFDVMTEGDHGNETGYGISAALGDNEHLIIVVDTDQLLVAFVPEGQERSWPTADRSDPTVIQGWSFDQYCALTEVEIARAWSASH